MQELGLTKYSFYAGNSAAASGKETGGFMRLNALIRGDVRFLWKYGFFGLYAVFTVLYLLLLSALPSTARQGVSSKLIYSDPAAMGLFFMGAFVLLEKSQRINCALFVSPVRIWEYITAKIVSFACVGLIVGMILHVTTSRGHLLQSAAGILLGSALFSLCGLLVAMRCSTLNRFIILTIPAELLISLPAVLIFFKDPHPALLFHPGAAAMQLICGTERPVICILSLVAWLTLLLILSRRVTEKTFLQMGGATL
jgi:fluoroquinolone transport system permease protein